MASRWSHGGEQTPDRGLLSPFFGESYGSIYLYLMWHHKALSLWMLCGWKKRSRENALPTSWEFVISHCHFTKKPKSELFTKALFLLGLFSQSWNEGITSFHSPDHYYESEWNSCYFRFASVYSKANYSSKGGQLDSTQNHCGNVSILISCQPRLPLHMVHKWNVVEHVGIPKSWGNLLIIGNTGAWLLQKAFKIKLSVGSILC